MVESKLVVGGHLASCPATGKHIILHYLQGRDIIIVRLCVVMHGCSVPFGLLFGH